MKAIAHYTIMNQSMIIIERFTLDYIQVDNSYYIMIVAKAITF
jgi:hypothetical protein